MCVCVCTLGKKKRTRGQELRRGGRERETISCFQAKEAADIPKGECSVMCPRQYNLPVGQTGALNPVLSDSRIHVLFTVNTM